MIRRVVTGALGALICCAGCDGGQEAPPAPGGQSASTAAPSAADAAAPSDPDATAAASASPPDATPAEPPEPQVKLAQEAFPEGPPGPIRLLWPKEGDVSDYGWFAESPTAILIVYRLERYEEEACPRTERERCTHWIVQTHPRDGSAASEPVLLVEADSPSGVELSAVFADDDGFGVLWREGRYTLDADRVVLTRVNDAGEITANHDLLPKDFLPPSDDGETPPSNTTTGHTHGAVGPAGPVVCWADRGEASDAASLGGLRDRRVYCRHISEAGPSEAVDVTADAPRARRHWPAVAFSGERGLVAWVRGGAVEARPITAEGRADGPIQVVSGEPSAVARRLVLTGGHGGYLISWQTPEGDLYARRVEAGGTTVSPPLSLAELGGRHALAQGAVAVPEGFIVTLPQGETTKLALIDPRGERVEALEREGKFAVYHRSFAEIEERKARVTWELAARVTAPPPPPPAEPEDADAAP